MIAVPLLNQFYPAVPLKELTGFYSVGGHEFPASGNPPQTHRVAVLSYLPRTLMIHDNFQYNNKYVLFIEAMPQVTSVAWAAQLYLNGVQAAPGNFISTDDSNAFEFSVHFSEAVVTAAGIPLFDRMVITCTVISGGVTKTMTLEHNFARATNVINTGLVSGTQSSAFAGEPQTFNFMANQLKEYFSGDDILVWNGQPIEILPDNNEALLLMVLGILYYNIQASPATSSPLIKYFEWRNFTRTGFVTAINDNTAYADNFRIGPGMIPLHILSDALTDINTVPDFLNIPGNNAIYAMLSSTPPLTYNSADISAPDPAHIQQSKARLMGNRSRLIALFHYAMFPKSAIKMVAILVKFLFEASRKNDNKECKNRTATFPYVNLATHKQTPDLARNILTHYFRDPYNKIDVFAPEALRAATLSWSPYTYSLHHHIAPRILKAYFAKRRVRKISDEFFELNFERNDNLQFVNAAGNWLREDGTQRLDANNNPIPKPAWDNFLGRDTLLVVETWNCHGKTVRCNVSAPAIAFTVGVANGNMQVQMNGNYVYDIERPFEDYSALHTNAGGFPGTNQALAQEYLDVNHSTDLIARIRLRPNTVANFTTWTNNLGSNNGLLTITTQLTDNTPCLFGNNTQQTAASGNFLNGNDQYNNQSTYTIVNRMVFEIQHADNPWNFLPFAAVGDGRVAKVDNPFVRAIADGSPNIAARRACFFYYDDMGDEHFFGEYAMERPAWIASGIYATSAYQDGRSCLIDVTRFRYTSPNVNLSMFDNTNGREYIDVSCFAGLAGAMARNNLLNLGYNGFSNNLGQSVGGSVSHRNGARGDLRYIRTAADGALCLLSDPQFDYGRQVDFHNSLREYAWAELERMLSENFTHNGVQTLLPHCQHYHKVSWNNALHDSVTVANGEQILSTGQVVNVAPIRHDNHLHVQGFAFARVFNLIA
jgi:hypothetical protein